jgi:uncharacterized protein (TIGR02145 family)
MVGLGNVDNTSDVNKPVSSATQTALATKVNILDTMSMLSKYLRKADFPSGSSVGEFMYWDGSKWVNLSPGTTGQSIIMTSSGPSWGCIITNSADTASSNPTLLVNTLLTDITIATTGATGIETTGSGLPAGVTATWSANVITINGTPTAAGTFNYTIPLTGGCDTASATGTITVTPAPVCPTATITDDNNIHTYKTVSIGDQCWMAENLRTDMYNDGTVIPDETANTSVWGSLTTGARAVYTATGVTDYVLTYGYLYNWYAVTDSKKLCPTGWHVPTDTEWRTLTIFIGSNPGNKLKKNDALWTTNTGTDDYDFSALPGGYRTSFGSYFINGIAFFWSATEFDSTTAWTHYLFGFDSNVTRDSSNNKSVGMSVRCLKDSL